MERYITKPKKLLFVLLLLIGVGAVSVIFCLKHTRSNERGVIFVSYEELLQKIDSEENFLLIISRKECRQCKAVKRDFAKAHFDFGKKVYCIEYSERNRKNLVPKLQKRFKNIEYVPYVTEIKNGVQTRYYQNFKKFDDIKKWYSRN